jgi:hypothetical protein
LRLAICRQFHRCSAQVSLAATLKSWDKLLLRTSKAATTPVAALLPLDTTTSPEPPPLAWAETSPLSGLESHPRSLRSCRLSPSPKEVLQFLACVRSIKHRAILTICYVADTQWYLEGSPELMREAMQRLQQRWEDRP